MVAEEGVPVERLASSICLVRSHRSGVTNRSVPLDRTVYVGRRPNCVIAVRFTRFYTFRHWRARTDRQVESVT
jgi:hypothetical protein